VNTLPLRSSAPLQSCGSPGSIWKRATEDAPTKSGWIGLILNTMGHRKGESNPGIPSVERLAQMRFGVRLDDPGTREWDYQVMGSRDGFDKANGKHEEKGQIPTERQYIANGTFLIAFEDEDADLLNRIRESIRHSVRPIFLGRKSMPPHEPVWLNQGVQEGLSIEDTFQKISLLTFLYGGQTHKKVRALVETSHKDADFQIRDQPVVFDNVDSVYRPRGVRELWFDVPSLRDEKQAV